MEISSFGQMLQYYGINIAYAVIALVISVIALVLIDKFIYRKIDFIEEIRDGNIAAAIFYSTLLLFVGVVVAIALS
ncbi:DUF350 domain-containing protein [Permianibacter aggregans]|uniref:Uncharacterized protein DUF350 n=1 Tax=Permianibacter aggregans TaxID=1510150 RepID=A0A4R6UHZ3_9GAMM|nr:DUF350 domain-containing protein [Permianibacter aggregans]QGX40614.1 DUF350 domain-containing protein [Permianibacter aggregans]TDQ46478.1 uncharacterized protein DUF350 [Permianibacter aggregans]